MKLPSIGNDPIILSGTPFLAYMTRVSSNISHPRAWIFTQFAVANIVSAILVSSNPTNLVLAGAFQVRFIDYTVNMIVPVVITVIVLFPCLLYVVFRSEHLIPKSITLHELPEEVRAETPKNPCIPYARGAAEEEEEMHADDEKGKLIELAEIMHPFLDKPSAIFGSLIIAVTLIVVLVLNAVKPTGGELPVFWVTLPAAVVMFCWDLGRGWLGRELSRKIAHDGRRELEEAHAEHVREAGALQPRQSERSDSKSRSEPETSQDGVSNEREKTPTGRFPQSESTINTADAVNIDSRPGGIAGGEKEEEASGVEGPGSTPPQQRTTLSSLISDGWTWSRETFPAASFVLAHLPLALVPFAFTMFVLVQALVTKGWVPVFAYGWDHWVTRTGTIGAIGGMGFVSVVLCNVRSPVLH
jgi:Na+/H+ antiporter NhaD/arsenite permease-like protein